MTTTLIAASAGTGKTYRICELITARLIGGIDPARLLATTFTRKAAGELSDRVRAHVMRAPGLTAEVRDHLLDRLELSAVGTVHAVAHRLLTRFALPLGLSPTLAVLEEGGSEGDTNRHLLRVLQEQLPPQWETFETICHRLSLQPVEEALRLLQLMRTNAMSVDTVRANLKESAQRWCSIIGTPVQGQPSLDQSQQVAQKVLTAVTAVKDTTKVTLEAVQKLRALARTGTQNWGALAGLANMKAGIRSGADALLEPLRALGRSVRTAPGLHQDLIAFAELIPPILQHLDAAYGAYKRERGLMDFNDLECAFLQLVRHPTLGLALRDEISLFVVDEFQDTNPIQLAIFRGLHELAGETIWVGDRKQAIYGFRGTDASLVEGIWSALARMPEVTTERLEQNRRSQGGIVGITNALFTPVFGDVDVTVTTGKPATSRACERWLLPKKKAENVIALASGVAALLRAEPHWHPRDVAILVYARQRAQDQAAALRALGIPAVLPYPGLLRTREGAIIHAAVRVAADRRDALACTEVIHLLDGDTGDQTPVWFMERFRACQSDDRSAAPYPHHSVLQAIAAIPTAQVAAPDLVRAVIAACDLPSHIAEWGSPGQRATNMDALVELATSFADASVRDGKPATPAGLIAHWDALAQEEADLIPVPSGTDAVQVVTYHASKGLQWPVVVCGQLDFEPRPRMFAPVVIGGDPAASDPLAGRNVAYWAWPFGRTRFGVVIDPVGLRADAAVTAEGLEANASASAEMQRLLYVGCTRAQERLIIPTTGEDTWLDGLGPQVASVFGLTTVPSPTGVEVPTATVPATTIMHRAFDLPSGDIGAEQAAAWILEPPAQSQTLHPARWKSPSSAAELVPARVVATASTGGLALQVSGTIDPVLIGQAVHTYLAAGPALSQVSSAVKALRAAEILSVWGVSGCIDPGALVHSSDALWQWIATRWPGATVITEVPMEAPRSDGGFWRGTMDVVVISSIEDVLAIIDHKTTGGRHPTPADALVHAPQLHAYRAAGKPNTELWVHHVLAGTLAHVAIEPTLPIA